MAVKIKWRRARGETKNGRHTHFDVMDPVLGVVGRVVVRNGVLGWWRFDAQRPRHRNRYGWAEREPVWDEASLKNWMEYGVPRMPPRRKARA